MNKNKGFFSKKIKSDFVKIEAHFPELETIPEKF